MYFVLHYPLTCRAAFSYCISYKVNGYKGGKEKMGLFINHDKHKSIYKNQEELTNTNQKLFRRDHLSELLNEQQKINHTLHQSILELKKLTQQQNNKQKAQRSEMNHQFNKLYEYHDKREKHFTQKLLDLETANRKLQQQFTHKKLIEQEQMDQIHALQKAQSEMMEQLKQYALRNKQVENKVNKQISAHKQVNEQVAERLEIQEQLSAKTLKQLDNIRSIEIKNQLNQLKELQEKYDSIERKLLDVDAAYQELQLQFKHKQLSEQEWMNHINALQKTKNELMEKVNQYALINEQTGEKVDEQMTMHMQLNELVLEQTKSQAEFLTRLENQEAMSEKVLRQVRHFHSVLFGRTRSNKEKKNNVQPGSKKHSENHSTKTNNYQQNSSEHNEHQKAEINRKPLTRKKDFGKKIIKGSGQKKVRLQKPFRNYQRIDEAKPNAPRKDDMRDEK